MKKIISLLCALVLILTCSAALAQDSVTLYTNYGGTTINTPGAYAPLTNPEGVLYSGPGMDYTNIGTFEWNHTQMHCLSLAYDQYGATWVLVNYDDLYFPLYGYVRLTEFDYSDRQFLLSMLPYEFSYDQLNPEMLAMLYFSCDGRFGPGEYYYAPYYLNYRNTAGVIILSYGDWALLELEDATIRDMGIYAKCRVWVELSNLMY